MFYDFQDAMFSTFPGVVVICSSNASRMTKFDVSNGKVDKYSISVIIWTSSRTLPKFFPSFTSCRSSLLCINSLWRRFLYKGSNFCTQFHRLNNFFKRRSSYHYKAEEFRNMHAFEFFQLLNKNMINGTLKVLFFIDISWRWFLDTWFSYTGVLVYLIMTSY